MNIKSRQENKTKVWDEHLALVAIERSKASFKALYDHFGPLIKAFAFKAPAFGQSDQLAEELVQETMIKVWSKAVTFNPEKAQASTWIFTIARNVRIDLLRKNQKFQNDLGFEENGDEYFSADNIWGVEENTQIENEIAGIKSRQQLGLELESLPPEQKFILRKVFLEDRTHAEAAQELGIALGTVKSRVRLALSKLKVAIDR